MSEKYINSVKRLYLAGELGSDASLRILERKASLLDLDSANALKMEEELVNTLNKYRDSVVDLVESGNISDYAREELEDIRDLLEISEEDAAAIEQLVIRDKTVTVPVVSEPDFIEGTEAKSLRAIESDSILSDALEGEFVQNEEPVDGGCSELDSTFSVQLDANTKVMLEKRVVNDQLPVHLIESICVGIEQFKGEWLGLESLERALENGSAVMIQALTETLNSMSRVYACFGLNIPSEKMIQLLDPELPMRFMIEIEDIMSVLEELETDEVKREAIRRYRNQTRSRMTGYGFTTESFLTAQLSASAANLTTGILHGAVNLLGKGLTSLINSTKKHSVLKKKADLIGEMIEIELTSLIDCITLELQHKNVEIDLLDVIDQRDNQSSQLMESAALQGSIEERIILLKRALCLNFYMNGPGITALYAACLEADNWQDELAKAMPFFEHCHKTALALPEQPVLMQAIQLRIKHDFENASIDDSQVSQNLDVLRAPLNSIDDAWLDLLAEPVAELLISNYREIELAKFYRFYERASNGLGLKPDNIGQQLKKNQKEELLERLIASLTTVNTVTATDAHRILEALSLKKAYLIANYSAELIDGSLESSTLAETTFYTEKLKIFNDGIDTSLWSDVRNNVKNIREYIAEQITIALAEKNEVNLQLLEKLIHLTLVKSDIPLFCESMFSGLLDNHLKSEPSFPRGIVEYAKHYFDYNEVLELWQDKIIDEMVRYALENDFNVSDYAARRDSWLGDTVATDFDRKCCAAISEVLIYSRQDVPFISSTLQHIYQTIGGDLEQINPDNVEKEVKEGLESLFNFDTLPGSIEPINSQDLDRVVHYFRNKGFPIFRESIIAFYCPEDMGQAMLLTLVGCYRGNSNIAISLSELMQGKAENGWTQTYIKGKDASGNTFEVNKLPSYDTAEAIIAIARNLFSTLAEDRSTVALWESDWSLSEFLAAYVLIERSHVLRFTKNGTVSGTMLKDFVCSNGEAICDERPETVEASISANLDDMRRLLQKACASHEDKDFWSISSISVKHEQSARACFGVPPSETIYAVIDNTIFKSAENGVAFAESGIYWKNDWTCKTRDTYLPWSIFSTVSLERDGDKVLLGDGNIISLVSSEASARKLIVLLSELQAILRNYTQLLGEDVLIASTERVISDAEDMAGLIVDCTSRRNYSKMNVAPNIPIKKASNAIKHFCIPSNVEIYALFDATVFGSNNEGIAFTDQGLYWKNKMKQAQNGPYSVSWEEFINAEMESDGDEVYINGMLINLLGEKGNLFETMLRDIQEGISQLDTEPVC